MRVLLEWAAGSPDAVTNIDESVGFPMAGWKIAAFTRHEETGVGCIVVEQEQGPAWSLTKLYATVWAGHRCLEEIVGSIRVDGEEE